ncbi:M3 family metallopeptidase [uncultured Alistipes sp.]|uniref:M3 family metallopeptidase n=1 Tax=uncultured Alistipes sp. TaxID=538949 RepID=UPI0026DED6B2|nr:M3 family metallopeptidase [uncultured Alistipes sp.]
MKRFAGLLLMSTFLMTFASCGSSKQSGENPLLTEWKTPYGVPPFDQIRPEHFMPAFEQGMSLHDTEIAAIVENNDEATFENVILAFDNSGQMLAQTRLVFEMLCAAETNERMQAIQEQALPMLSAHADRILLNEPLFARVKEVYDRRESLGLDAEQSRLLQKTYDRFVRSGALLEGEQKERLKQINEELTRVAVRFGNNLLAENNNFTLEISDEADLDGLPAGVRDAAREKADELGRGGKWVFTLHKPSLIPFLTYASKRALREELYKAYLNRCNHGDQYDNKQLINDFIRLRTEKAHLLGYPSYAAYVVADEMAGTVSNVYALLDEVWQPALERAAKELDEMTVLLHEDLPGATFESWDWWYYAEKLRKKNYTLDEEMLRPYFSLENVQSGAFFLANRLYGITFRPIAVPVYHEEVRAYEVLDQDETHLGVLYFDYFPRPGKSQGAWCGNYVEQVYRDGKRVAPVLSIVCNFTRPTGSTPALLTLDETKTLFHEFGHALHFLFHDVKYRGLSEVEGDFVELPSQIMENWATEPEMLKQYAVHYRSDDVIPDHLVGRIRRSEYFNQGFNTTELVAAALTDMDIHSIEKYEPFDVEAFEHNALRERRRLMPQIEPRYRYPYFSHIFDGGYSAGYYFYVWAEVLDKDAFQAFKQSGDLFNRRLADKFRRELLARGGSEDGMSLYRAFRGADPDKTALLVARGLIEAPQPAADSVAMPEPSVRPVPVLPDSVAAVMRPTEGIRVKASLKKQ